MADGFLRSFIPLRAVAAWRKLHLKLEALERRQAESEALLDAVLGDVRYQPSEALGMNGQSARKEVVRGLFEHIGFTQMIETGTYLGATTGYLATEFRVPVWSCELVSRYYGCAHSLLRNLENINLYNLDSRIFLKALSGKAEVVRARNFFYLDSHWYDDLPLLEELKLIFAGWQDFVIMIDDFQVPGDIGYGFDQYPSGHVLCIDAISTPVRTANVAAYFPAIPAALETGKKRGTVVLVSPSLADAVDALPLLKRYAL